MSVYEGYLSRALDLMEEQNALLNRLANSLEDIAHEQERLVLTLARVGNVTPAAKRRRQRGDA